MRFSGSASRSPGNILFPRISMSSSGKLTQQNHACTVIAFVSGQPIHAAGSSFLPQVALHSIFLGNKLSHSKRLSEVYHLQPVRKSRRQFITAARQGDEKTSLTSGGPKITRRQAIQLLNGALGAMTVTLLFKMKEQFRLISPQVVLSSIGFGRVPSRSAVPAARAAENSDRLRSALEYVEKIDKRPAIECPDFPRSSDWINSRPLSFNKELKGKVVLLDFFTYCCINCQHVLAKLGKLEAKYGQDGSGGVVVVGVHSAKFSAERETENVAAAVERYDVRHPVINDERMELWNAIGVSAWPTLALVGPKGNLLALWSGERQEEDVDTIISAALEYYSGDVDYHPLPSAPKRSPANRRPLSSPLRYPGKVALSQDGAALFISDSGNNRILEVDAGSSEIRRSFGSGEPKLKDSSEPAKAAFHSPQGLAEYNGILYVADTESHAVRAIELATGVVRTIGGNGEQGYDYMAGKVGTSQLLSSPWDVEVRSGVLFVAMAGTHQIWTLELPDNTPKHEYMKPWQVFSGSGRELEKNSSNGRTAGWAQPSHLSVGPDGTLYVADSESSSVRAIDLKTTSHPTRTIAGGDGLIPENLFAFGDQEGKGARARFQHPLAVCCDGEKGRIYVADSYNHRIKVIDETGSARVFCGTGSPGLRDGSPREAMFWEPGGLSLSSDGKKLYVSDTNNSAIRVVDTNTRKVSTINVVANATSRSSSSSNGKRLIPNRRRAIQIDGGDVSPEAIMNFSITLPRKSHFTPGATSRYQVNAKGNGEGDSELSSVLDSGLLTKNVGLASFCVDLGKMTGKLANVPGIEVEAVTYYCTEEDDVCRSEANVFNLDISVSGPRNKNLQHEVVRKVQTVIPSGQGTA